MRAIASCTAARWRRSGSRRESSRARSQRPNSQTNRTPLTELTRRGGSRYGLRPARLPPRLHGDRKGGQQTAENLYLSTDDRPPDGVQPWLKFGSARWLNFE